MAALAPGAAPARKYQSQESKETARSTSPTKHGQSPAAPSTPSRAPSVTTNPARAPSVNAPLVASSAAAKMRASAAAIAAGAAAASATAAKATASAEKAAAATKLASLSASISAAETGAAATVAVPAKAAATVAAPAKATGSVMLPAAAALAAMKAMLAKQPLEVATLSSDVGSFFPDKTPMEALPEMQPATPEKSIPPLIMQLNSPNMPIERSPTSRRPLGSRRMSISKLSPEAMLAEAMKLLPPREGSADARPPMNASTKTPAAQSTLAPGQEAGTTGDKPARLSPAAAPVKPAETPEEAQRRLKSEMGSWANTLKAAAATSGIDSGLEHLIKKANPFLLTRPKRDSDDPEGFPTSSEPSSEAPTQRSSKHSSYMIVLPKPASIITKARIIEALPPTNSLSNAINNSKGVIEFINNHAAGSANSAAMTPSMAVSIGLAAAVPATDGDITPRTVDFNRVSNLLQRMTTQVARAPDVDPAGPSQDPGFLASTSAAQMSTVMIRSDDPRDAPRAPRGGGMAAARAMKDNSNMNLSGATPGLPAVMNNKGRRGSLLCLSRDGHPYSDAVFHNNMEQLRRAESDSQQPGQLTSSSSFNSLPPLEGTHRSQRHISMARYDTTTAKATSLAMGIFRAKPRESQEAVVDTSYFGSADYSGMDFYGGDNGSNGGTRDSSASGGGALADDPKSSRPISSLQVLPPADHHLIQKATHTRMPAPVGGARQRRGSVLF